MDLIERQAVIDTIHLYFTSTIEALKAVEVEGESVYDMKQLDLILNLNKGLCNAIRDLPSAQPEPQCNECPERQEARQTIAKYLRKEPHWIPCRERLPRSQEEVIVSIGDTSFDSLLNYTTTGWLTPEGKFWIVDNEICNYVIAWMPLPESYKGE